MPEPIFVLVNFILYFIDALTFAMLLRVILGWFLDEEGKLMRFLYTFTEPAVLPIRKLFYKMHWFQDSPLDLSFMFSWLALSGIQMLITLMV